MKRTIKTYFNCSRENLNRLFACNRISALVWNKILEANAPKVQSDKFCGIDLGEIHSIATFESGGKALIVTGRKLRSVKQYQLKKLAEFDSKLSKSKKYSRQNKKLRRAKRRMLEKTNAQIRDLNHKITRCFVNWAVENKIAKVYVGNPEGVQRRKRHKIVSQKLSRWNFGKHLEYLTYKLLTVGIELEKISEAYSTQTCPKCGRRHKCKSRNYQCSCGYVAHRDIHGARNILSLGLNGRICITTPTKETKYLRTA